MANPDSRCAAALISALLALGVPGALAQGAEAPPAPETLTALTGPGLGEITLVWSPSTGAETYQVYRRDPGAASEALIATTPAGASAMHSFATDAEGFATVNDQWSADIHWDDANERVSVYAWSPYYGENFERGLPSQLTPEVNFSVTSRWSTTGAGSAKVMYPLFLAADGAEHRTGQANTLAIEYYALKPCCSDWIVQYTLTLIDTSGVQLFKKTFDAQLDREYRFEVEYSAETRIFSAAITDDAGASLTNASAVIGNQTGNGFRFDRVGVSDGPRHGDGYYYDVYAWVDDINITMDQTRLSLVDTGLPNGEEFHYRVTAVAAGTESTPSPESSATTIPQPPDPPSGLTATTGSEFGEVELQWMAPLHTGGEPVTAYRIYRGEKTGEGALVQEVGNVTEFQDSGLRSGVAYYYRVSAVSELGEGRPSAEASAFTRATLPETPQALAIFDSSLGAQLSWQAPPQNDTYTVSGYRVYRNSSAGAEDVLLRETGPGGESRHTFTGSAEGFTTVNDQWSADIHWDDANERVSVYAWSPYYGENFERGLPSQLTPEVNFSVTSRWSTTGAGSAKVMYPLFLAADGAEHRTGQANTLAIEYYALKPCCSDWIVQYTLRFVDSAGVARINEVFSAALDAEYRFEVRYDHQTQTLRMIAKDAGGTEMANASYSAEAGNPPVFWFDRVGVSDGPRHGDGYYYDVYAWVDDILVQTDAHILSFVDSSLASADAGYYRVSAMSSAGEGSSISASAVSELSKGDHWYPTSLRVEGAGDSAFALSRTAPEVNETLHLTNESVIRWLTEPVSVGATVPSPWNVSLRLTEPCVGAWTILLGAHADTQPATYEAFASGTVTCDGVTEAYDVGLGATTRAATVEAGERLAVRLAPSDPALEAQMTLVYSPSTRVTIGEQETTVPLPELPALLLIGSGLLVIAGVSWYRRAKSGSTL